MEEVKKAEDHTVPKWFNGTPDVKEVQLIPYQQHWNCPTECGGEMHFNGMTWPTGTPGYHHTCDKCGYTAAARGEKYPRVVHRVA